MEQSGRPRGVIATMVGLAALGVAGGVALSNASVRPKLDEWRQSYERVTAELAGEKGKRIRAEGVAQEATRKYRKAQQENEAMRAELSEQDRVIERQRLRLKNEEKARRLAEARAEREAQRAAEEAQRAELAEHKIGELETELTAAVERAGRLAEKNLGDSVALLAKLEERMPEDAAKQDEAERAELMKYDCSQLQRVMRDLEHPAAPADALERSKGLAVRFGSGCKAVGHAPPLQ